MREAQISLSPEAYAAMGIDELVTICVDAGIVDIEELECTGNGGLMEVELESRLDEDRLDGFTYVYQWEFLGQRGETFFYIIGFIAPELPEDMTDHAEELLGPVDPDVRPEGTTLSLVGPQEAIRSMINGFMQTDVRPDLQSLGEFDGNDRPFTELTGRQREVITAAYDAGYYDIPRSASTEQIASALNLDSSTVSEHLQRAERNLLQAHLQGRTESSES